MRGLLPRKDVGGNAIRVRAHRGRSNHLLELLWDHNGRSRTVTSMYCVTLSPRYAGMRPGLPHLHALLSTLGRGLVAEDELSAHAARPRSLDTRSRCSLYVCL